MKHMLILLWLLFCSPVPARADLFGADVVVLTQILANAVLQLARLREIIGTAEGHLDLVRQINQGINDSLQILRKIDPNLDPGIYRDWESIPHALEKLVRIYGRVPDSPEARVQKDMDQGIAEAVSFNNGFYSYSTELDRVGEQIQSQSHAVSPGGAAKLSAQALGLVLQVLNQNLRAQSTLLKLQAQEMAARNRREKAGTQHFLETGRGLRDAMMSTPVSFQTPRF